MQCNRQQANNEHIRPSHYTGITTSQRASIEVALEPLPPTAYAPKPVDPSAMIPLKSYTRRCCSSYQGQHAQGAQHAYQKRISSTLNWIISAQCEESLAPRVREENRRVFADPARWEPDETVIDAL